MEGAFKAQAGPSVRKGEVGVPIVAQPEMDLSSLHEDITLDP